MDFTGRTHLAGDHLSSMVECSGIRFECILQLEVTSDFARPSRRSFTGLLLVSPRTAFICPFILPLEVAKVEKRLGK